MGQLLGGMAEPARQRHDGQAGGDENQGVRAGHEKLKPDGDGNEDQQPVQHVGLSMPAMVEQTIVVCSLSTCGTSVGSDHKRRWVAVGTTITGRPRTDPCERNYRIKICANTPDPPISRPRLVGPRIGAACLLRMESTGSAHRDNCVACCAPSWARLPGAELFGRRLRLRVN